MLQCKITVMVLKEENKNKNKHQNEIIGIEENKCNNW